MKAIPVSEVRKGDTLLVSRERLLVADVKSLRCETTVLTDDGGRLFFDNTRDVVILLHRPWPEGKNEADMLAEVALWGSEVGAHFRRQLPNIPSLAGRFEALREALDAYILGKPMEKSSDSPKVAYEKCCYPD